MSSRVSIVVPVHNEAAFMSTGLEGVFAAADEIGGAQIIVVENGSTDDTARAAREVAGNRPIEVIEFDVPDYGSAMRAGFLAAEGDWVVNFDIDYFSGDFLRRVVEQPATTDIVIGSKRDPRSDDRRPPIRRLATRVFNLLLRALFGSGVSDTHGMKAFRREVVAEVVPQVVSRQDLFDTELVLRAERKGFVIVEVPVVVEELREARSSLLARVPRTVRGLFRIRKAMRQNP